MYVPRKILVLSTRFEGDKVVVDNGRSRREARVRADTIEETSMSPPGAGQEMLDATRLLGPWPQLRFLMVKLLTMPEGHGLSDKTIIELVVAVRESFLDRRLADPDSATVNKTVAIYAASGRENFKENRKGWHGVNYDYWAQFDRIFRLKTLRIFTDLGFGEQSVEWQAAEAILLAVWHTVRGEAMRVRKDACA